jgi:peptide/nickel transport system substrate-binding protein
MRAGASYQSVRKRVKPVTRRMLAASFILTVIAGCHDVPLPHTSVVIALPSDPQSLDPRFGTDANASRFADLVHTGLTRADASARRVPDAALSWETPDPTTVVFHLRSDLRFADGTDMTAADVSATYEAVRDPALASPKRAALGMLDRIDIPDRYTVVMRLRAPSPAFLDATGLGILPAARAHDRAEVSIGAGPFRVVSVERGDRIVLAPNPGYPGGPPRLDPVVLRIVPDEVVRVLELKRGGVQLLQDAPEPEMVAWLAALPDLTVRRSPGTSFAYLAFNFADSRLADRRVREAIACALDRPALIESVLGGAARLATGLLAPEHWAYVPTPSPRPDVRRARLLLDRAGYTDPDGPGPKPRMRFTYKTSTDPGRRRLAQAIQAQLAHVGIALDVRTFEWGTLYADVRSGNFQLSALAWVGVSDPDLYYLAFHSSMQPPEGFNRGRYRSRVMDRLTARARTTSDPAARRALYARVQRRAARDLPVAPLWWEDRVVVHTRRLQGFEPSPSGDLRGLAQAWMSE